MPHTISLEEMIIAVVSLMFDINSVLVLQWCGKISPPTQWLLVMAVASLEITARLLAFKGNGHWALEGGKKGAHVRVSSISWCEVSGPGHFLCVSRATERGLEIEASEYLAINMHGQRPCPATELASPLFICFKKLECQTLGVCPWRAWEDGACPGVMGEMSNAAGDLDLQVSSWEFCSFPDCLPETGFWPMALSLSTTSLYPPNKSESNFLALYS